MIQDLLAYSGLFFTAVAAGSILPVQSEPVLVAMIVFGSWQVWLLVLIAGIGNSLGSVINWQMGRTLENYKDRRWFPAKPHQIARAHQWYDKYGRWSLLLSWVPIFGEALTIIAGVLEEKLVLFFTLVFIGKTLRYAVLAWLTIEAQKLW